MPAAQFPEDFQKTEWVNVRTQVPKNWVPYITRLARKVGDSKMALARKALRVGFIILSQEFDRMEAEIVRGVKTTSVLPSAGNPGPAVKRPGHGKERTRQRRDGQKRRDRARASRR